MVSYTSFTILYSDSFLLSTMLTYFARFLLAIVYSGYLPPSILDSGHLMIDIFASPATIYIDSREKRDFYY